MVLLSTKSVQSTSNSWIFFSYNAFVVFAEFVYSIVKLLTLYFTRE